MAVPRLVYFCTTLVSFIVFICCFPASQGKGLVENESTEHPCQAPENVTFPNAANTSITIQWQYDLGDDKNQTIRQEDIQVSFQIRYWPVNEMESASLVNVSGERYIDDHHDNATYIRHDLDGLQLRQYYSFQIRSICCNSHHTEECVNPAESNWTKPLTRGAIDGVSDKPTNVTIVDKNEHNITLTWDEPMNPNGHVVQYEVNKIMSSDGKMPRNVARNYFGHTRKVNYKMATSDPQSDRYLENMYMELRTNQTFVTLEELEADTMYEFQVAAQTRLGVGLAAQLPVTTKAVGTRNYNGTVLVVFISIMACVILSITAGLTYTIAKRRKVATGNHGNQTNYTYSYGIDKTAPAAGSGYGTYNQHTASSFRQSVDFDQLQFISTLSNTSHRGYDLTRGEFTDRRHRNTVAVAIKTCHAGCNDDVRGMLKNEAKTLELLNEHVNVVQLIGTCQHQGSFYEVLEYVPNKTLHSFLRESSRNLKDAKETLLDIAIGISTGMEFITQQKVVHRNLSSKHVLMGNKMTVKISGFGYATRPGVPPIKNPVSALTNWRPKALESLTYGIHTKESDVWSYGVILWEITNPGKTPYNAHPYHKMKQFISQGNRLPKPRHWQNNMYELMLQCWLKEPTERPEFHHLTAGLKAIKKKKQFYPNSMMDSNFTDSSLDLEDFDIVASSEPDENITLQINM